MKRVLTFGLLAALCGTAAADVTLTGENTKIEFTGKKPDGKHDGGFKTLTGAWTAPGGDVTKGAIEVTIQADSLWSDNDGLTKHLKNQDFFDVKTHKTAKFKSTKIEKDGSKYKITGDLTLLGKTKSISFPAEIKGNTLSSAFTIDRTDFGMTYGKGKIEDKVALRVKVDGK